MEIHKDFIQTMKSIFIPVTPYIFLMAIYIYSWFIVIQLLYIEIKARYLTVIKDFTNEVKSIKTKPDKSVIISTQRSILKFAEFKDNIKKYVDFLEFGIFIDLVLPVTIVVGSYESILELECWTFGISFVVLVIGSYIWTISYNLRVKRSESDLTLNLNRWLNPNIENGDEIELKVLKKAAMHFSEQKFIDEFNSA
jgi:ABC-type multidrug transport system permease subunit